MLSISKPLTPDHAAWYFKRDDYYLAEEGSWHGSLASDLNLSGAIQREDFLAILNGFDKEGNKLVASAGAKDVVDENGKVKKSGHRSGVDLTFSAPKSVSILSYHDSRINEAFQKALKNTLDSVEKEFAYTRFKDSSGKAHPVKTENLLWATFEHSTSRELDPQLHSHCVLMNMTRDPDGNIKTLHNDILYKNKKFLGQYFRNQLSQEIQKIGYQVDVTDRIKGFFEIRGVGEEVIDAFSKRSKQVRERSAELRKLEYKDCSSEQITSWAKERVAVYENTPQYDSLLNSEISKLSKSTEKVYEKTGDAELAAIATTDSRVKKRDVSKETVLGLINDTCSSLNTTLSDIHKNAISQKETTKNIPSAKEILKSTVEALIEGQSTFSKTSVLGDSLRMGVGYYSYSDFDIAFNDLLADGSISKIGFTETSAGKNDVYSSKEMLAIESEVMDLCKTTKGTSQISVAADETDIFVVSTDINLKMKVTLQLDEKDPEKSNVKFQKTLSKIDDQAIKIQLTQLRELALKAKSNPSLPKVKAEDYPALHQFFEKFGYGFTKGQKDAARLIASTKDRFSVIQGDAGTGKSFSCLYSKNLVQENGFYVRGLAPTGKAATGLGSSAEIASERCGTLDSFILQFQNTAPEERAKLYTKGKEVWVVDEAGMCGSKKIHTLMKMAIEADAKVVFIGDRKQFASIEAGRMFSELQDKAGIDMVNMPDVMRQKTQQTKDIVKAIGLKNMDFAFSVMQGLKEVGQGSDKTDTSQYAIGNTIILKADSQGIPASTACKIVEIKSNALLVEYFDEEKRVYQKAGFNVSRIKPDDVSIFEPPKNQYAVSNFKLKEYINIQIPEQGLPSGKAEIVAISDSKLTVRFTDPSDNTQKILDFDPTKNPSNYKQITSDGKEFSPAAKDSYVDMITVETDKQKCLSMVAQDYLDSISAKKDTLLITGTNKDKDNLNDIIRPEFVKQGLITDSKQCNVFRTKSMAGTGAMIADSYSKGQIIVTNNTCGEIPRGTQAEIQGIDKNNNAISVRFWDKESGKYKVSVIDVRKDCKKFSTYDQIKKEFGVGDRIIFLKNDKKNVGVNNGEIGKITSIDDQGNVKAILIDSDSKKEVEFNINNRGKNAFNYVDHAYCITDYKSQGATTQRLLWYAPTDAGPLSSNSFYVAITRCKEEVGVYTNDADALREKVKAEQHKESTLDYSEPIFKPLFKQPYVFDSEYSKDNSGISKQEHPILQLNKSKEKQKEVAFDR